MPFGWNYVECMHRGRTIRNLSCLGRPFLALFIILTTSPAIHGRTQPFYIGADVSYIPQDEAGGHTVWMDNGVQKPILQILKDHHFNLIRLRLFYDPTAPSGGSDATTGAVYSGYSSAGFCGLGSTIAMAKRAVAAGFVFALDIHYSDNWADPGKQYKPHAWANASFAALTDSVRFYTGNTITAFRDSGALPRYVQIGNEITAGMIWPDGSTSDWNKFAALLKAGIAGVKDVDTTIKIVMHIDLGGSYAGTKSWIDNAVSRGVVFDILGESCYTIYQGPSAGWKSNFDSLAIHYPKYHFYIAEYSQEKRAANDIMFHLPDEKGIASIIWEPLDWNTGERFFTRSGNTYASVPGLIDLYDTLAAEYGNDTFPVPTVAGRAAGGIMSPEYSIVNASAWLSGAGPLWCRVPGRAGIEIALYNSAGKLVGMVHGQTMREMTVLDGSNIRRRLPPGHYLLSLIVNGVIRVTQQGVKLE